MRCHWCDPNGLVWFSDDGKVLRYDDLRGNTAYRCRHTAPWLKRTQAVVTSGYRGGGEAFPDECEGTHNYMKVGAYLWCQTCRRSERPPT